MTKTFAFNSRSLWLSASVLAIMAASPAMAQTTVLTSGQTYDLTTATDTGSSNSDGNTSNNRDTVSGCCPCCAPCD